MRESEFFLEKEPPKDLLDFPIRKGHQIPTIKPY